MHIPKQKPGYVGDWVLEESHFPEKVNKKYKKGSISLIENYRTTKNDKFHVVDTHDRRSRFRSEVKRITKEMK